MITRLNVGGPAQHVVWLSRGLERYGYETTLLTGRPEAHEASMERFALEHGVRFERVPGLSRSPRGFGDLQALIRLWRVCRRVRPRIVHTHTAKAGALGRVAARLARVPLCLHTFHGHVLEGYFPPPVSALVRAFERALAPLTDRIVALCPSQHRELTRRHRVAPAGRVVVIPLGIDTEPFVRIRRERERAGGVVRTGAVRRRFGIAAGAPLIGVIGRLVPIKRVDRLLQALSFMDAQTRPHLLVAGAGPLESTLRGQARALGLAERVHFAGVVEPVAPIYAELDLLALSSDREGTPVVILEALASGVPVVATAVGGVPDLARIAPGALALVETRGCEEANARRLAKSLKRVLASAQLRRDMVQAGRNSTAHFSLPALFERTDRLYRTLLARSVPLCARSLYSPEQASGAC